MRPNIPKLVYDFARNRNLEGLRQLQESGACLTQFHHAFHPWFNAIAKLAFDGYGDAAEFLVDHQMGHVNDLVSGYSYAGDTKRTLYWAKQGGSISICIKGLAFAGNVAEVNKILKQNFQTFNLHQHALQGFAMGRHHALVDDHLHKHFPATHFNHLKAISEAIVGYGKCGDERGLELAKQHGINPKSYYNHLSVSTPINEIPEEYRKALLYKAAFLGHDDYITNSSIQLSADDKHFITLNYYQGGHQPPEGFSTINHPEIIESLTVNKHLAMIEPFLISVKDDRALENPKSRNDYSRLSGYHPLSAQLSRNEKLRTRELLHIKDEAQRKRMHQITGLQLNPNLNPYDTYEAKLTRIGKWFHHTSIQSFECAWMLLDKANFNIVVNFIVFTKQANTLALTIDIVNEIILAELLDTTPSNAQKIHSHFSTMFTSVLNKNKQETLPSPTLTRKGSH